jgi:hypothetical protein
MHGETSGFSEHGNGPSGCTKGAISLSGEQINIQIKHLELSRRRNAIKSSQTIIIE